MASCKKTKPATAPINSTFAILDVKKGRAELARRVARGETIHVLLIGTISGISSIGNDDGVSREFSIAVDQAVEIVDTDQEAA